MTGDRSRPGVHRILQLSIPLATFLAMLVGVADAGRVSLQRVHRSVLPVVALGDAGKDYRLLGNAILMDEAGHAVAPASLFRSLPTRLVLPVSRLGLLLPTESDETFETSTGQRIFARLDVLELDEARDLALLRVHGPLFKAVPVTDGPTLRPGDERHIHGYGEPGILPFLFPAAVTAVIPAPGAGTEAQRYALDANATAAADGGALFDRATGRVSGVTVFHLRNVHRVMVAQPDFEYGPAGTCLAIPIAEVRAWMDDRLRSHAEANGEGQGQGQGQGQAAESAVTSSPAPAR